eukprot:6172938-Pleurochrysis_carterae.AAC.1
MRARRLVSCALRFPSEKLLKLVCECVRGQYTWHTQTKGRAHDGQTERARRKVVCNGRVHDQQPKHMQHIDSTDATDKSHGLSTQTCRRMEKYAGQLYVHSIAFVHASECATA